MILSIDQSISFHSQKSNLLNSSAQTVSMWFILATLTKAVSHPFPVNGRKRLISSREQKTEVVKYMLTSTWEA